MDENKLLNDTHMDELINKINDIAIQEYQKLKSNSKTFGELDGKVRHYASDMKWSRKFENHAFYDMLGTRIKKLYNADLNKKTID